MRKFPIFVVLAILVIFSGFFIYQHFHSKIDITFNFLVTKKVANHKIVGNIDGAGKKKVILPLSKTEWDNVKINKKYNMEVIFYKKHSFSNPTYHNLSGPFWSNEANQGILTNKVTVVKIMNLNN